MRYWVGLTDRRRYEFLAAQAPLDEVNFWTPSGKKPVDLMGSPFLFKLHKPDGGRIVGGGHYYHFTRLPARMAWDAFGAKNGAPTFEALVAQLQRRRAGLDAEADLIGCVALVEPFFLPIELWVEPPVDWPSSVEVGKTYDSTTGSGAALWERVQLALAASPATAQSAIREPAMAGQRYGSPIMVSPRLGQGTFRAKVIDAYERRCVITNARTLPVLQAAHIKPYAVSGPHAPENGPAPALRPPHAVRSGPRHGRARPHRSREQEDPRRVRERARLLRAPRTADSTPRARQPSASSGIPGVAHRHRVQTIEVWRARLVMTRSESPRIIRLVQRPACR